jgi:hypothetical protein
VDDPRDETEAERQFRVRAEADAVDVHQYAKRFRALKAIGIGAAAAAAVWLTLIMVDSRRNPCERVRDHFCKTQPGSPSCAVYEDLVKESVENGVSEMRQNIRAQCQTKIDRLKAEDGIKVR